MDSLTQALLGAAIQGSLLGRVQGRKALLYGAALGTLPDLDVLLNFGDAVAQMTYHRGFSHSLFLLTGLSFLLTWLLRWRWPSAPYSNGRMILNIWLILLTHVLIDACTTYGTQLFWPLPYTPLNFSNIFVIDPLYSLPLLLGVVLALFFGLGKKGRLWINLGLLVSTLYMASTFINQALMREQIKQQMAEQGLGYERILIMPTPFNTLAWRVLAQDGDSYLEGVRSWADQQPLQLKRYPAGAELRELVEAMAQHQRLQWFNDGWMSYREVDGQLVVTDLRLGLLGNHSFRFVMAERDAQGRWQYKDWVEQLPMSYGTAEQRALFWQRIFSDQGDFESLWSPASHD